MSFFLHNFLSFVTIIIILMASYSITGKDVVNLGAFIVKSWQSLPWCNQTTFKGKRNKIRRLFKSRINSSFQPPKMQNWRIDSSKVKKEGFKWRRKKSFQNYKNVHHEDLVVSIPTYIEQKLERFLHLQLYFIWGEYWVTLRYNLGPIHTRYFCTQYCDKKILQ